MLLFSQPKPITIAAMEHTQIVTALELEGYAELRDSEAVIPELVWLLVNESVPDLISCRIPYGDAVNQPGWDGLVETRSAFRQYVPEGRSFWEIGTNREPQKKATSDFKKRTESMQADEMQNSTYVFVTPRAAGAGGWPEPAQTKWLKGREKTDWNRIVILDGQRMSDWLREFPALGKWLLRKIGTVKGAAGFSTPAEHWENLSQLVSGGSPPLPANVFLIGREKATRELQRLLDGEISQLVLATESESDAEDFVAAYLKQLEPDARRILSNKCLFVRDADAWLSFANLRKAHVLVASPRLGVENDDQLHLAAKKNGHRIIIPVSGAWAQGAATIVPLRSPPAHSLESTLREAGFEPALAREFAGAGALNLAALKRHIRGLGELPPYASWDNARVLAQAQLIGGWIGSNPNDREALETLLGKSYGEWIEVARTETLRADTPLIQRNEKWKTISRGEAWSALGPRLTNDDLDRFRAITVKVLGEQNPKFDLPKQERMFAGIQGKTLSYSDALRAGMAESLALLGSRASALTSCNNGKPESVANAVVHELLHQADWKRWATLNDLLPMLAEAAPHEFMAAVEDALRNPAKSEFLNVYAQEDNGFGGWNYMTGVLWALESLAWNPNYLVRITTILGDLAAIDPGGNWANRPKNALTNIFLPWLPQTAGSIAKRKAAIEALQREQPGVCWNLLLSLLPQSYGTSTGTHKPTWRDYIPEKWTDSVSQSDYWLQVQNYAELATEIAASDLSKLVELVDRLPDLPQPANARVLDHLCSDSVIALPESDRVALWEALVDLASKHRKFADTQWAMGADAVTRVEQVAASLAPTSSVLLYRRLFSDRDLDLYEEVGNYETQARKLEEERKRVVSEIVADGGIERVLEFVNQAQSPRRVGFALGSIEAADVDARLLPAYLGPADKPLTAFVSSFVMGRFFSQQLPWVDKQLSQPWTVEQRLAFLTLLPFESQIWHRAETALPDGGGDYWRKCVVNPWGLDESSLVSAAENLLRYCRPRAAVTCIGPLAHKNASFPTDLALRALLDAVSSPSEQDAFDQHSALEIIGWLQGNVPEDSEELFRAEWAYLPLLDRHHGGQPKTLERRLASDARFFCELVALIFRSDKDEKPREANEAQQGLATNAYRLLRGWRTIPGAAANGSFDGQEFTHWLAEVEQRATESGHLRVSMNQIGQTLAYAPADPSGLWIHKSIAAALDRKDGDELRSGLVSGLFNKRGVHGFSAGQEERQIAARYRENAEAAGDAGFHRLADAMRGLADTYEADADRQADSNPYED